MPASTALKTLILGTAGHIDHGKTALVRALTGVDTDRLPQEKQRGITIDIGFARLDLGDFELGIVDVPGHERFVRNMLAGATGNDLVMLVVAADDSVMPQTREHLEILSLLDVHHGLVVITKCDLVEDDFLQLVEQEIGELVEPTFLKDAPIVRTSATTGQGIDELKSKLTEICRQVESAPLGDLFRLAVDRSFTLQGQGTVVTGSVASGRLSVGDAVEWLPAGKTLLKVRTLELHGMAVESVQRGQRAAIGLAGVHHRQIMRGHELATPGYLKPTRLVTARLTVSDSCPWPVRHRRRLRVHIGTGQSVATMAMLSGSALNRGQSAAVQLFMAEPVAAACGQPLVVRSLSPVVTLGGARVLEPLARRISRRHASRLAHLDGLGSEKVADRVSAAICAYGLRPWTDHDLCRDANVAFEQVASNLRCLAEQGQLIELAVGQNRVARVHLEVLRELEGRLIERLQQYHAENPLQMGLSKQVVAGVLGLGDDESLRAAILTRICAGRKVTVGDQVVALANFAPKLSPQQEALYGQIVASFLDSAFQPPSPSELADRHGVTEPAVRQLLELATAQRKLKHLGAGLYLHAEIERQMRQRVGQALRESDGAGSVSQIRSVLSTTRKFAVPFCEYLDRIKFTRRRGDLRVLTAEGEAVMKGEAGASEQ